MIARYHLWQFVIAVLLCCVQAYEKEMTVYVEAGKSECFYHPARSGETIDIEYQVIDGGHGDLDISFSLRDPIGLVIVSDYKKLENIHRHEVSKDGDYRFCFDNTFSSFNRKTVFFELIIENDGMAAFNEADKQWNNSLGGMTPEEMYEIKVHEILEYVGRVHMQMARAHQILNMLRSTEARDRNLAEANYSKVNKWSLFQICAMVLVGLLQVFMVRSIFETNSRMSTFWKKLGI